MDKTICVYCSSSNSINDSYFEYAKMLGKRIAERKDSLVYGGSTLGLMGTVADEVGKNGGKVVGVIPNFLGKREIANNSCSELIVTDSMRERKEIMETKADAFIALPGGYGTLEELFEIITAKIVQVLDKPIVILNINNFYEGLLRQIDKIIEEKFANPDSKKIYFVTDDVDVALDYIENYKPFDYGDKWFDIHTAPRK